jgi:hypothetical protein
VLDLCRVGASIVPVPEKQASAASIDDARIHANVEERRARILARFGAKDEAIGILQKLLTIPYDGALTPALLRLDPDFDNLRDDPHFQRLIEGSATNASGHE